MSRFALDNRSPLEYLILERHLQALTSKPSDLWGSAALGGLASARRKVKIYLCMSIFYHCSIIPAILKTWISLTAAPHSSRIRPEEKRAIPVLLIFRSARRLLKSMEGSAISVDCIVSAAWLHLEVSQQNRGGCLFSYSRYSPRNSAPLLNYGR